jgi:hypothetical protein
MMKFSFIADQMAQEYCEDIVHEMTELFGITEDGAIGRVNDRWSGLEMIGPDQILYHDSITYWANIIYYGPGKRWWEGTDGLKPIPYP